MRRALHALLALVLLAPGVGQAQVRLSRDLTLTGSSRLRYEGWGWFDTGLPGDPHNYGFFAAQTHLVLAATPAKWLDGRVDVQNTSFVGLPDDANAPPPLGDLGLGAAYYAPEKERNDSRVFINQVYLSVKNPARPGTYLRAGRFEYLDGVEVMSGDPVIDWVKRTRLTARLIGTFGFSHVSRSFDGVTGALDRPRWNLTAVAARPRQGGFAIDGMKEVTEVDFAGLTATVKPGVLGKRTEARLFYLYYEDRRDPGDQVVKADNRPAPARTADSAPITLHQVGGHVVRAIPAGKATVDLMGWGVVQKGDWGLLDHSAWAAAVEAGVQFPLGRLNPWLRAGYLRSSGDDDPADGTHGTFFQTLTTVRLYAQFPFFNMMNSEDLFAQVVLRPRPGKLSLRSDLHLLRLSNENDLWYVGSGVTMREGSFGYGGRPSGGEKSLATLLDASVTWDPHPRVSVYGYYGHAFGKDVIRSIYPGRSGTFAYLETTLKL